MSGRSRKRARQLDDKSIEREISMAKKSSGAAKTGGNSSARTISVAIPGSVLTKVLTLELKTSLAGQIARACCIFGVTEIIIFSDDSTEFNDTNPCIFLARLLQYLETPQYLRRKLFPVHKDLQSAGLLNPLDAPHHLRANEIFKYREGVVIQRNLGDETSMVDIGLKKPVKVDHAVNVNTRVTVELSERVLSPKSGILVSPSKPSRDGIYWGYNVRLAKSLSDVFVGSELDYDFTIGTSEKGEYLEDMGVETHDIAKYKHLLVVFGGPEGIEVGIESDANISSAEPSSLFDIYVNTCKNQGSRTIRTEEAIIVTLSAMKMKYGL